MRSGHIEILVSIDSSVRGVGRDALRDDECTRVSCYSAEGVVGFSSSRF